MIIGTKYDTMKRNRDKYINSDDLLATSLPFKKLKPNKVNDHQGMHYSIKQQNKLDGWNTNKVEEFQKILKAGVCAYEKLDKLFIKNGNYVFYVHDEPICGTIVSTEYLKGFFPCFRVTYSFYAYSSKKNIIVKENNFHQVYSYTGNKILEEVRCEVLTANMKVRLEERGVKYMKYCRNFHHVNYQGSLLVSYWGHMDRMLTKGRVMIDHTYYENTEAIYYDIDKEDEHRENDDIIPMHKLNAFLGCYDLTKHRKWGLCVVENITDIEYKDDAFVYLTLNETLSVGENKIQIKDLIKDLVQSKNSVKFDDIIEGKSCGMIFLLHGPPGVGKTLTAEATAEVLHIPLYYLSAGELGSDSNNIESNLKKVMELTTRWNAIILIDEADVFLEKRETAHLERNAVVSIFLKYLESHVGIIFLTSNRVKNLDNAFLSRISLVVNYDDFTPDIKKTVWENLLRASEVDPDSINIGKLIHFDLNGRQIKNIIKLGQCLAIKEEIRCSTEHLIALCEYFDKNHRLTIAKNYC